MDFENNDNQMDNNTPENSSPENLSQSEPQQAQPVITQENYVPYQPQPAPQPVPQPMQQPENNFNSFSSDFYKQNMKNMKQEYKTARRQEKQNSSSKDKSIFRTTLISSLCSFIVVCILFSLLVILPSPSNSVFGRYIRSVSSISDSTVNGSELKGGQYYSPNKETITIKDETTDVCTAVYAKVSPSIVGIRIVQVGGSFLHPTTQVVGEGTGTVYSEDGYIITNYHVIETAIEAEGNGFGGAAEYEVRVYFDTTLQEYFTAEIIGGDSRTDLALLKISLTGMTPVEFADSDEILIGSEAIVMGGGGGIEFIDSVNKGIISGLHRNITTDTGVIYDLIQTDAAINPGNSGGALLNSKGELIGICFLKISADAYDNMAFAIPANTVKNIISQIKEDGSADSPYIGVSIDTTYTKQDAEKFDYPLGALIAGVEDGKSADRAGIKEGDIITEFNGTKVTSYDDLRGAITKCKVGDEVEVKLYRTDDREEITVTLEVDNYNN